MILLGMGSVVSTVISPMLSACPTCKDLMQSPMAPHRPTDTPFFEGWYTKIDSGSTSIAVIIGGILSPPSSDSSQTWRGQVSVIFKSEQGLTRIASIYPDDLVFSQKGSKFEVDGTHVSLLPQFEVYTADRRISFSPDSITINHPELCNLRIDREGAVLPWSSQSPFGPEGILSRSSLLKSHWYVHNRGSSSSYSIKWGETESQGRGMLHQEKNWGTTFPSSWLWLQATDDKHKRHLVFAGGDVLSAVPVPFKVWAFAYHSPEKTFDFNPAISGINAHLETDCKSWFNFSAKRPGKRVDLRAQADPKTFVPVDVILDQNWVKGARESFHTRVDMSVEEWGIPRYQAQFNGGALEFGGFCHPS